MEKKMGLEPIMEDEWETGVEIVGLQYNINKILKMLKINDMGVPFFDMDSVIDSSELDRESKKSIWGCANNPYYVTLHNRDKEEMPIAGKKQRIELHFKSDGSPIKFMCILSCKYNLFIELVSKPVSQDIPVVFQISPIGMRQIEIEEVLENKDYWLAKLKG